MTDIQGRFIIKTSEAGRSDRGSDGCSEGRRRDAGRLERSGGRVHVGSDNGRNHGRNAGRGVVYEELEADGVVGRSVALLEEGQSAERMSERLFCRGDAGKNGGRLQGNRGNRGRG